MHRAGRTISSDDKTAQLVVVPANGTGNVPHRANVYVMRNNSVAPEQRQYLVVQLHGQDVVLGHSSQPEVPVVAYHANNTRRF